MKGVKHEVYVCPREISVGREPTEAFVEITNQSDSYYSQAFESWQEIAEFLKQIEDAGLLAFGPRPSELI